MQYKTIVLELLQQRPEMHERLRKKQMLLSTLVLLATELKDCHEALKVTLSQRKPGSDPIQISSEAMEIAVKRLEDHLPSESQQSDNEALSLDAAMASIRKHTSHG